MGKKTFNQILIVLIYTLFGVIDVFIIVRWLFVLMGVDTTGTIVEFVINITNPLIGPFEGAFDYYVSGNLTVDINSIIAIITYTTVAWFIVKLIDSFFLDAFRHIFRALITTAFNFLEIIILTRIVLKFFNASSSDFTEIIYSVTQVCNSAFFSIVKDIETEKYTVETSTIFLLLIVLLFDFLLRKGFEKLSRVKLKSIEPKKKDEPFVAEGQVPSTPAQKQEVSQQLSDNQNQQQHLSTTYPAQPQDTSPYHYQEHSKLPTSQIATQNTPGINTSPLQQPQPLPTNPFRSPSQPVQTDPSIPAEESTQNIVSD